LTTATVVGDRHHHQWDSILPHIGNQSLELVRVHVPLERVLHRGLERNAGHEVHRISSVGDHVGAGRVEVHVVRNNVPRLEHRREEDVLRRSPLVGRQDVVEPEDVVDRGAEPIVAAAPRVGLVTPHHRRPLLLAHRTGPRIGQQIDVDVARVKVEDVVSGFLEPLLPFRLGEHPNRLNDLDPIWFVCLFLSHLHSFRRPSALARTREPPRASRRGTVDGECFDGRPPTDSRCP